MFLRCFGLFECGAVAAKYLYDTGRLSIVYGDSYTLNIIYNFVETQKSKELKEATKSEKKPQLLDFIFTSTKYGCMSFEPMDFTLHCNESFHKETSKTFESEYSQIAELTHSIVTIDKELKKGKKPIVDIRNDTKLLANIKAGYKRYEELPSNMEPINKSKILLMEIATALQTERDRLLEILRAEALVNAAVRSNGYSALLGNEKSISLQSDSRAFRT